jgi:hypothetical protein
MYLGTIEGAEVGGKSVDEAELGSGKMNGGYVVEGAGEVAKGIFGREYLKTLTSFMDELESLVSSKGITIDEFNKLRLKPLSEYSEDEIAVMKSIRESMSMPDSNTIMQKVISK